MVRNRASAGDEVGRRTGDRTLAGESGAGSSGAFFRFSRRWISGPEPDYAGRGVCGGCATAVGLGQPRIESDQRFTRNGVLSRSSPIVVRGPWPGITIVSSGKARTVECRECIIFRSDPPGRYVRPMEPANRVV